MDRQGDIMHYSPAEQGEFSLPFQSSIDVALVIAAAYRSAAEGIYHAAADYHMGAEDAPDAAAAIQYQQRVVRAGRLVSLATSIEVLCTPELMARSLAELEE